MALDPLWRSELTALVVQPDDRLTLEIRGALESLDVRMTHFRDGSALLAAIDDARPSANGAVIITDLRLPTLSGIRMLQELAARRISLPSIITTAWVDDGICQLARALGARHVLFKPVQQTLLCESIAATLPYLTPGVRYDSTAPHASPHRRTSARCPPRPPEL